MQSTEEVVTARTVQTPSAPPAAPLLKAPGHPLGRQGGTT